MRTKDDIRISLLDLVEEGKRTGTVFGNMLDAVPYELGLELEERESMVSDFGIHAEIYRQQMPPVEQEQIEWEGMGFPDEAIRMYFREMGEVALLSAEEEQRLARRVAAGDERAREQFLSANLRLVVAIAKKYVNCGLPLEDLIQEGNIGLIKALDKYDYTLGNRFSTYATWWIRQAIVRAIGDHGYTIRRPAHICESVNRMKRVSRELFLELGREPTLEELASGMGTTEEKLKMVKAAAVDTISLDTPVGEGDDTTLGSFVEDQSVMNPDEITINNLRNEAVHNLLETLNKREAEVLRYRYGLHDGENYTLDKIAEKYGLTRERVRQIEAKALCKLRHPSRSRRLQDYCG